MHIVNQVSYQQVLPPLKEPVVTLPVLHPRVCRFEHGVVCVCVGGMLSGVWAGSHNIGLLTVAAWSLCDWDSTM